MEPLRHQREVLYRHRCTCFRFLRSQLMNGLVCFDVKKPVVEMHKLVGGWPTPLKNISQLGWLFPIYGKIKHVPNYQPNKPLGPQFENTKLTQKNNLMNCREFIVWKICFKGKILEVFIQNHKTIGQNDRLKAAKAAAAAEQIIKEWSSAIVYYGDSWRSHADLMTWRYHRRNFIKVIKCAPEDASNVGNPLVIPLVFSNLRWENP